MTESILNVVVLLFVVFPVIVLIHELGHVLPTLLLTDRRSRLRLGKHGPRVLAASIGRVDLDWRALALSGDAFPDGTVGRRAMMIILAGGPIASVFAVVLFIGLASTASTDGTPGVAFRWGALFAIVLLIQSALPVTYRGPRENGQPEPASDGYWLRQYWRHPEWREWAPRTPEQIVGAHAAGEPKR